MLRGSDDDDDDDDGDDEYDNDDDDDAEVVEGKRITSERGINGTHETFFFSRLLCECSKVRFNNKKKFTEQIGSDLSKQALYLL